MNVIPSVEIIIPVYNALKHVKKCLKSLDKYNSYNYKIIIVDDNCNEETKFFLNKYKNKDNYLLITNDKNLKFTKSVNRGLKNSNADISVILNSDTIVTKNWIEKIINCFKSNKKIGIVGVLSNAASWQSVPHRFDKNGDFAVNKLPKSLSLNHISKIIEKSSKNIYPMVPSINGFCFCVKKEVINRIGLFDEVNFPSGYGEEDDFCLRAKKAGFKLALADDTYVYHSKTKSYKKSQKDTFTAQGLQKLLQKHGSKELDSLHDKWIDNNSFNDIRNNLQEILKKFPNEKKEIFDDIYDLNKLQYAFGNAIRKPSSINIVIVTYNSSLTIRRCIDSLIKNINVYDKITIVDNNSKDGTKKILNSYNNICKIYNNDNKGFSDAVNSGFDEKFDFTLLLNPDTVVFKDWRNSLLSKFYNSRVAAVGPISDYAANDQNIDKHLKIHEKNNYCR